MARASRTIPFRYLSFLLQALAVSSMISAAIPSLAKEPAMDLGAFSVSLAVKDLEASRQFYEKLGFEEAGGNVAEHWLILRNGETVIGLFEGLFEKNTLTFNPGWDQRSEPTETFTDVRELQRRLRERGLKLEAEVDESTDGPGFFYLLDPDGNPILVDQHR